MNGILVEGRKRDLCAALMFGAMIVSFILLTISGVAETLAAYGLIGTVLVLLKVLK